MRVFVAASLICGGLLVAACGGEADVAPAVDVANTFTRGATPASLATVFGRANVIPETIAGPEGAQMNVTAIYPTDPARRIEVVFRNEEERTDLSAVMVSAPESQWTGPGGVKIGDGIEAVEAANGMPFEVMGFQWDYGGFVADWKGGKLGEANGCAPAVRLAPGADSLPADIVGDGVQPASNLPAMRAAQPKVSAFGISWAPQS
jgi:hypothetical protein